MFSMQAKEEQVLSSEAKPKTPLVKRKASTAKQQAKEGQILSSSAKEKTPLVKRKTSTATQQAKEGRILLSSAKKKTSLVKRKASTAKRFDVGNGGGKTHTHAHPESRMVQWSYALHTICYHTVNQTLRFSLPCFRTTSKIMEQGTGKVCLFKITLRKQEEGEDTYLVQLGPSRKQGEVMASGRGG